MNEPSIELCRRLQAGLWMDPETEEKSKEVAEAKPPQSKLTKKKLPEGRGKDLIRRALDEGKIDLAEQMLKLESVFVEEGPQTLLRFCVQEDNRKWMEKLYEHDTKVVERDDAVLLLAASHCNADTVQFLAESGADPWVVDEASGRTAMHEACLGLWDNSVAVISYLAALRVNVNAKDKKGWTPLHVALKESNLSAADLLVRCGADLKTRLDGLNLLHFCIKQCTIFSVGFVHSKDRSQLTSDPKAALDLAVRENIKQWLLGRLEK